MLRSLLSLIATPAAVSVPPAVSTATRAEIPRPVELPHIYLVEVMGRADEEAAATTKYVAALTPSEADAVRERLARAADVIAYAVDLAGPQSAEDLDLLIRSRYAA